MSDKKINCIICGKEFSKRGNKLTCSDECSYRNQLKNSRVKNYSDRKLKCDQGINNCLNCPYPDCIKD